MQEGLCSLLSAIDRFDLSNPSRLATYAIWWIRQGIQRAIAAGAYPVRLNPRQLLRLAQLADLDGHESRAARGGSQRSAGRAPSGPVRGSRAAPRSHPPSPFARRAQPSRRHYARRRFLRASQRRRSRGGGSPRLGWALDREPRSARTTRPDAPVRPERLCRADAGRSGQGARRLEGARCPRSKPERSADFGSDLFPPLARDQAGEE